MTNPILCSFSGNPITFLNCMTTRLFQVILANSNPNKMQIDEIISCGRINKGVYQPCCSHLFYIFSISIMSDRSNGVLLYDERSFSITVPAMWSDNSWLGEPWVWVPCVVIPHISGAAPVAGSLWHFWLSSLSSYTPKIWGVCSSENVRFSTGKLLVQKSLWLPWSNRMLVRAHHVLQKWQNKRRKELFITCFELQNHLPVLLLGDATMKLRACQHFLMKGYSWILHIPLRQKFHIHLRDKCIFWVPSLTCKFFTVNGRKILLLY